MNKETSKSIDLVKLFELSPIDRKGELFAFDVVNKVERAVNFFNNSYKDKDTLEKAVRFVHQNLVDGFKGDFSLLTRIGFFPATEAVIELDFAIKQALASNYKSAIDHLRRAFELIISSIYLLQDDVDSKKSIEWMNSEKGIPPFSNEVIKNLAKLPRFEDLDTNHGWSTDVKQLCWKLCDYVHVKGTSMGFRSLNLGDTSSLQDSYLLSDNFDTFTTILDCYVEVVQQVSATMCLYNPILLVGLPLDEKFGLNLPIGFYHDSQSESINAMIPNKYKSFFEDLKKDDMEIKDLVNWVESFPGITEEEFERQIEDFNTEMNKRSKSTSE